MAPAQRRQSLGVFRRIGRLAAGTAVSKRALEVLVAVGVMRLPLARNAGEAGARIVAGWSLCGTQDANQLARKYLTVWSVGRKIRLMSR